MKVRKNYPLRKFTTMAIGGPAKYFAVAKSEKDLLSAIKFAKQKRLPWRVLGEGSNLVAADQGYRGVIVQNQIQTFETSGSRLRVGAGNNLVEFISKLNRGGRAGLERMAGIPGTVGGAVYGCAGAYGQEIKDHLMSVHFFDGKKIRNFSRKQCGFAYRSSIFKKHQDWVILDITLNLPKGNPNVLSRISRDTIKLREKKYRPGLKCPGSFFKNIKLDDLPAKTARRLSGRIAPGVIKYGKLPAGYLLETVGAKGMRQGKVAVAGHHGNLIYNLGGGRASDVKKLSTRLKGLVKKQFAIIIDEEVQYL